MISNIQHQQQYDNVMMDKILSPPVIAENFVTNNNNNNNKNKDIHILSTTSLLSNRNTDVIIYDPNVVYFEESSVNTKEIITVASQQVYETLPTILTQSNPMNASTDVVNTTTTAAASALAITLNSNRESLCLELNNRNASRNGKSVQSTINHEYAFINVKCDPNAIRLNRTDAIENARPPNSVSLGASSKLATIKVDNQVPDSKQSQQNHTNALRCIEDVHNYSKINRYDDSTNSSSPEDEEEDDDDDFDDELDDEVFKKTAIGETTTPLKIHIDENLKLSPQRKYTKSSSSLDEIGVGSFAISSFQNNSNGADANQLLTIKNRANQTLSSTDVPDDENESGTDKITPDHHARRPMNAFLIFCKRHRAIVRDKYKHLENRQITKILGEWWATLSTSEKACYTNLAKQYKDAFFKANPNFKWYKLPAPPLRTCSIRPGHQHYHHHLQNSIDDYNTSYNGEIEQNSFNCDNECVKKSNLESSIAYNRHSTKTANVGVFKLADEAQMGGLSSLMSSSCTKNNISNCSNSNSSSSSISNCPHIQNCPEDDNKPDTDRIKSENALQDALNETQNFLLRSILPSTEVQSEPFQNMRNHAILMENDHHPINGKRKSFNPITDCIPKKSYSPDLFPMFPKKTARSCKGKKYMELMYSGQITSFGKKGNAKNRTATVTSQTTNGGFCTRCPTDSIMDGCGQPIRIERSETAIPISATSTSAEPHIEQHSPQLDSPSKQFDASDFDLEEKIKALPAQCLESYLMRKRETKKKKKIGSKRRQGAAQSKTRSSQQQQQQRQQQSSPPQTIQEARERMQNAMVGSQKRKARKESITRRDINALNVSSPADLPFVKLECESSNDHVDGIMVVKQETEYIIPDRIIPITTPNATTSDLLILAEVATNHIADK